jgi:deoxycytidine triphosphate deaminase
MSILSDRSIREEILNGNIIIHDPERNVENQIQNCSFDFTIGPYYYRRKHFDTPINPWSKKHSCAFWGNTINEDGSIKYNYLTADTISDEYMAGLLDLPMDSEYILLNPQETILGHTREFIGGRNIITTVMKARSSVGRSDITICRDAGYGDIGYINRWTLEITNNSSSKLVLPIGKRIGQICFQYTTRSDTSYHGKYQDSNDINEIVEKWNPAMMCPCLWKDRD